MKSFQVAQQFYPVHLRMKKFYPPSASGRNSTYQKSAVLALSDLFFHRFRRLRYLHLELEGQTTVYNHLRNEIFCSLEYFLLVINFYDNWNRLSVIKHPVCCRNRAWATADSISADLLSVRPDLFPATFLNLMKALVMFSCDWNKTLVRQFSKDDQ